MTKNNKKFNILFLPAMLLLFLISAILTILWGIGYSGYWLFSKFKLNILKKRNFVS